MKIKRYIFATIIFILTNIICYSQKDSTIKTDTLKLRSGWTWLSFPRLNMDNGNPTVHDVLYGPNEDRIDPMGYKIYSELQNIGIGSFDLKRNVFDGTEWPTYGQGFHNVDSKFGYKLCLKYDGTQPENKLLFLSGDLIQPNDATLELIGTNHENWVGYYLPVTQSPFDAIDDDIESDLGIIKAQNWICFNENPVHENALWCCACNKGKVELRYGDMVIIKTNNYVNIPGFQWLYYGNPSGDLDRPAAEYYQYMETADYTPIFIELDTTQNPVEIGAFIEDSCVGATTVIPNDTLLLISAYTEGLSGDIYFEEYYGSNKSYKPSIKEYYVKNKETKLKEKRIIHTDEHQDYYVISFNGEAENNNEISDNTPWITCLPNPLQNQSTLRYFVPDAKFIQIVVYDLYGKQQNVLKQGNTTAGTHSIMCNGKDSKGKLLPNGIYIISIEIENHKAQTKIVIIR